MFSVYNIFTVARFEMKTLFRSWFFRIFAILALGILTVLNIGFFSGAGNTPWAFRGIPASIPYVNLLLLNVLQAVIGVFLASDFLKRDKKLDTTEVVYMRSMTNTDYVLGKSVGIMTIFMALNVLVLLLAAVFNFFFADVPLRLAPYLFYPLLLSLPTLIFIFGLSFLSMVLVRNQAVTFILLLGYIALTLFFLGQRFFNLFDYMGFHIPLMYSDFTGFGDLSALLMQRAIYLFLGLACIFATILMLKRLPQQIITQRIAIILLIVFGGAGLFLSVNRILDVMQKRTYRQALLEINNQVSDAALAFPERYELVVNHRGNQIEVSAGITVRNENAAPLEKYILRLNPGLQVISVDGGSGISYERNVHLLTVKPTQALMPGESDEFTVAYKGSIDESAMYLNTDNEERDTPYSVWIYKIGKRHAYITNDYVLLTPESMWYPMAGCGFSTTNPANYPQHFSYFSTDITTRPGLMPVSQGNMTSSESGQFNYRSDIPMPSASLIIGDYTSQSIEVDSVRYSLVTKKDHDFYVPYMNEIGDTLASLIREFKLDYEAKLGMTYPYKSLSLVEVPIHFYTYDRPWTLAAETVQPEMVLLPENGLLLTGADFKQAERWSQRRMQRSNMVTTRTEDQSRNFRRFVESTLISEDLRARFGRGGGPGGGSMLPDVSDNYLIYPNYFSFVHTVHSDRFPLFNMALESYIIQTTEDARAQMVRSFVGLSATEKTGLALEANNLEDLLRDPENKDIIKDAVRSKGDYLFSLLKARVEVEDFQTFLAGLLEPYRYRRIPLENLVEDIKTRTGYDFMPEIEKWYETSTLPAFLVTDIEGYKILDGNRERYQINFKVYNPKPAEGLLKVTFRIGGGGGQSGRGGGMMGGFGDPGVERIISIEGEQGKQIGVVLDGFPRMMMINTMIAKNLPASLNTGFEEFELKRGAVPFDGEIILDAHEPPVTEGEIIVDNEDAGFRVYNPESTSILKRLLKIDQAEEEAYATMRFWRPPTKWVASANDDYYGKFVRSAYFTRAGDGDRRATWTAAITEPGNYEVYAYTYVMRYGFGRGGRGGRDGGGNRPSEKYHYKIHHDDGIDEVVLDMGEAETGWSYLGSYYLSPDSAVVEITNESPGRIVIADAIRLLKR